MSGASIKNNTEKDEDESDCYRRPGQVKQVTQRDVGQGDPYD
jgi:hypothetical protein